MKARLSLLPTTIFFIAICIMKTNAQNATFASHFLHPSDWSFEENRGQLKSPEGNSLSDIKYFGSFNGVQVYCTNQKLSFVFTKTSTVNDSKKEKSKIPVKILTAKNATITASRLDLNFENANPALSIIPGDRQEMSVNYATASAGPKGINGVSFYKTLTYKNIYQNIDMVITAGSTGLEYKFIVHPGGKVEDIKLTRNGADAMQMLDNGGIKYETAYGTLEESKPQSFSANTLINSAFVRTGNSVSFKTDAYDHQSDLVIDPGLSWATYYGTDSDDEAYSIALDASGNVFISGLTNSLVGFATTGAYQTSLAGGINYDVFLVKFTSAGKLVWATYYGGDSSDFAIGCGTDPSGNVFVSGYTLSPKGIATSGAYQTAIGSAGTLDAFLAKFSNSGNLLWGTYFGGSGVEYVYGVAVDGGGNASMIGWTSSSSGIASSGSLQTSYAGGGNDAYIARFTGKGALSWATYYGGSGSDYGLGIGVDKDKNIYITGTTISSGNIATSGAFNTTVDPNYGSAYLAKFDSTGARKWGTYFGGGGNGDQGFCISAKITNHVYLSGSTANSTDIATNGAYQTSFGGTSDVFLADFSASGSLNWATYYGGTGGETAYGIDNDSSGNIFLAGTTSSADNMSTSDGYITSYGSLYGGSAFMAKFSSNGFLKYGTYFGGYVYESGRGVAVDNSGGIYITGLSASPDIATSGAFQTQNAGQYDAFIAKFLLCNLTASFSGPSVTCANSTVSYKAVSHTNSTYQWTVTGGTIKSGSNTDSIVVAWGSNGHASVKEKEINLSGCLDSMTMAVIIGPLPPPAISGDTLVCPSSSSKYKVIPVSGVTYAWSASGGTISGASDLDSAVVTWSSSGGTGYVAIKETFPTGCVANNAVIITIGSLPPPVIYGDTLVCGGNGTTYKVNPVSGATYSWTINSGTATGSKSLDSVIVSWQTSGGTGSVAVKETNSSGCQSSNTFPVRISTPLKVPVVKGDTEVCAKSVSYYKVNPVPGVTYSWTTSGGSVNSSQGKDSIAVAWSNTITSDTVWIQESTTAGCKAMTRLLVSVVPLPSPVITGDTLVCSSGASSFSVNAVAGDTYFWEITGGNISGANDQNTVSINWQNSSGKGSVLVYETDGLGCQGIASLPITITTLTKPVITGYTQVCPYTSSSYHVKSVPGVIYSWSVNAGSISSIQGRDSINVFWQSTPGTGYVAIKQSSSSGGCKTTDTMNVTIVPNNPVAISVISNGKGAYVFKSDDSSAAESGYTWTIEGVNYNGYHVNHIFAKVGAYHIILNVINASGCSKTLDTTIQISNAGIVLNETRDLNLKIFPNPFKDQTEIQYSLTSPAMVEISVCDMLGRNVVTLDHQWHEAGDYNTILDGKANRLTAGIYLVKVMINGSMETQKIVRVKD